jgi:hypothetical protein
VVRKPVAELQSSLDRLVTAGLLFRQGVAPHATYLFKHALVQHAAYGTLLREPRRALRARIVETLENQFAEIAESRPELLARHATEAGQIEKAAYLWGRAGQRSLDRSALVEAASPLHRQMIPRPVQHGVGSGRRVNPKAFPIKHTRPAGSSWGGVAGCTAAWLRGHGVNSKRAPRRRLVFGIWYLVGRRRRRERRRAH